MAALNKKLLGKHRRTADRNMDVLNPIMRKGGPHQASTRAERIERSVEIDDGIASYFNEYRRS